MIENTKTAATPWSEMGHSVKSAENMEDAIKMADLDYRVCMSRVYLPALPNLNIPENPSDDMAEIIAMQKTIEEGMMLASGYSATRRADTGDLLGIVGGRYTVIQNKHAFQMFDPLLESGELALDRAGKMSITGSRMWLLVRVGDPVFLTADDSLEQYIVLLNSHDGSMALRVINTPIRTATGVTAMATLQKSSVSNTMAIRHTENAKGRMQLAQKVIASSLKYYASFAEAAMVLAKAQLGNQDVERILGRLFPCKMDGDRPMYSTRTQNQMDLIRKLYHDEPIGSVRGTAWSFYSAIAEFVDFHRSPTKTDGQKYKRLQAIVDGTGADLKRRAFAEVTALQ